MLIGIGIILVLIWVLLTALLLWLGHLPLG